MSNNNNPETPTNEVQLKEGDTAPLFTATDQDGQAISLADFKGKKVALYFYPKDSTPGCTMQACNLRDNHSELLAKGITVLGISPDDEKSHTKFIGKHDLPFPLIADHNHKIADLYGVWGEKILFGLLNIGIKRTTFIISEEGIIEKIIAKVKTRDHSQQIFDAV